MRRVVVVVAVLLGAVGFAAGSEVREAGACTGVGVPYSVMDADVIFEGWVTEIEPIPGVEFPGPNHRVTYEVVRGYRGAAAGEAITVEMYLRVPGNPPSPCPTLAPDGLDGKYVMAGWWSEGAGDFYPFAAFYLQDGPNVTPADGSLTYDAAVRLAELVTDTNPERPMLTVEPAAARCGETVTFIGERFAPGWYVVSFGPWSGPAIAKVQVTEGSAGAFRATATLPPCRPPHPEAAPQVVGIAPQLPSTGDIPLGAPEEYASLDITGTIVQPFGDPRLEVLPGARCGGTAIVTGGGFEPNTTYPLRGGNPEFKSLVTGSDGRFRFELPIPRESCEPDGYHRVWILQPGFEEFGPRFAVAEILFELNGIAPPPGPPDVGDSPPANADGSAWWFIAAVIVIALGAGVAVSARRR